MATVVQIHLSTIVAVLLLWMVWHHTVPLLRESYKEVQRLGDETLRITAEIGKINDYQFRKCITKCMPKMDIFEGNGDTLEKWRIMNNDMSTCMNGCKIRGQIRDVWNGLWGH